MDKTSTECTAGKMVTQLKNFTSGKITRDNLSTVPKRVTNKRPAERKKNWLGEIKVKLK